MKILFIYLRKVVNIIFYDGDNSEHKMREFFINMLDFTEDVFTLVIDDANIEANVAVTKRFIDGMGLKIQLDWSYPVMRSTNGRPYFFFRNFFLLYNATVS